MFKTALIALIFSISVFAGENVDTDGHTPGKFTMDFDAAQKYAAEKNLPILLNFTGSDWCGWCKLMDKNVFNKEDWTSYAKENVVMVYVDFPKNKSLVPEKYVARNAELSQKYGVRGYPTYLILDPKTQEVLGKLGAGRDKTPSSFKAEVEAVAAMTESRVKAFADSLGGEKGSKYLEMYKKIQQNDSDLKAAKDQYESKVKNLSEETKELKSKMEEARVISRISEDKVEEYLKLRGELKAAEAAVEKFLAGQPAQNQENMKIYQELGGKVKEIQSKLSKF